jgi:2'-5' RNA ligase
MSSSDRTHFTSHWAPLPDWSPGRSLLACYVTFDDDPAVHAVVDAYQTVLKDVPALDLVERRWLHTTVQGVWFVDALPPTARDRLADALGESLAAVTAPEVTLGPPALGAEGVVLPLRPVAGLVRLRDEVRAGVREALGLAEPYVLPGQHADFDPHVTLGYANDAFPLAEVRRRLETVESVPPTRVAVRGVTLLSVDRRWQWTDAVHVPLAGSPFGNAS